MDEDRKKRKINLIWEADPESQQDQYKVTYSKLGKANAETTSIFVEESHISLPHSSHYRIIEVRAVSNVFPP